MTHLAEEHDTTLKAGADFCQNCEVIFESDLEGLEHYITHAISMEGTKAQTYWLGTIYDELKDIRKELLDFLLFGGGSLYKRAGKELFNQ